MLAGLIALHVSVMNAPNASLDQIAKNAFVEASVQFPSEKLKPADVAITLIQLDRKTGEDQMGQMNGDELIYPASVVKLFWLAYLANQIESRKVKVTPEVLRAAKDMIQVSSNDATGAIVNLTTGAFPGPELEGGEWQKWKADRLQVATWFGAQGIAGQKIHNRTFNEGPYGREKQLVNEAGRNFLSTNASARLMARIARLEMVSAKQSDWMKSLLRRTIPVEDPKADSQSFGFLAEVMPRGTQHWSKAGWTSEVRHDVSYNVMPDGREFVFCVFTRRPNNKLVLQTIASEVLSALGYKPSAPRTGPEATDDMN